jgi:hypothetical protein
MCPGGVGAWVIGIIARFFALSTILLIWSRSGSTILMPKRSRQVMASGNWNSLAVFAWIFPTFFDGAGGETGLTLEMGAGLVFFGDDGGVVFDKPTMAFLSFNHSPSSVIISQYSENVIICNLSTTVTNILALEASPPPGGPSREP